MTPPAYHRIRSLEVTGGFLQGLKLVFDDRLNCIIGGRGTGKTTVIEVLRYALDRMPDANLDRPRHQAIEKLLQSNLGGGSVRVEIETREGTSYTVVRGFGESPLVTSDEGKPVDINIGKDIIFGLDIYSQNQIEDIANDAFFQLQLIDKFIHREVDELQREIRETTKALEANAGQILETRRSIDDLVEATRELPDIAEKIRGFEKADNGGGELLRKEHEQKSLRTREAQVVEAVAALYAGGIEGLAGVVQGLKQRFEEAFDVDLAAAPNREVLGRVRDGAQSAVEAVERQIEAAAAGLRRAQADLKAQAAQLADKLAISGKAARARVVKFRQQVKQDFRDQLGRAIGDNDVVENTRDWQGYRLNPYVVRVLRWDQLPA